MNDFKKTVAVILFAVGGLLVLLGGSALLLSVLPGGRPEGADETGWAIFVLAFVLAGFAGLGLIALGYRFRVYEADRRTPMPVWGWCVYAAFSFALVALLATTWRTLVASDPLNGVMLVGVSLCVVGAPLFAWLRSASGRIR